MFLGGSSQAKSPLRGDRAPPALPGDTFLSRVYSILLMKLGMANGSDVHPAFSMTPHCSLLFQTSPE